MFLSFFVAWRSSACWLLDPIEWLLHHVCMDKCVLPLVIGSKGSCHWFSRTLPRRNLFARPRGVGAASRRLHQRPMGTPLSFMLLKCFATAVAYLLCIYKACQISKWRHSRVSSGDLTNQTALYSNKSFQLTKLADPTLVWGEMHGPEHARSRLRAQTMTSSWMCFINIAVLQESFQKKKIIRGTTTEWQFYIQSTARILGCPILSLPN